MTTLENQITGAKSEHVTLNAAKHAATAQRRLNGSHDRYVIYAPDGIHLAKPGTKPRGRMSRSGVKVDELPLEWRFHAYADQILTK